ncbi:MAG: respiratory chain complex I subunit 1 family protein [Lachnospiraceae bacterium]
MNERIITTVAYLFLAPLLGGLISGLERKLSARMQGRKGPSIFQSFYDVRKLFSKNAQTVNGSQFFLMCSYTFFIVFTGALLFAGWDLLLVFFTLTTAAMFLVATASCTHSPYSTLGANREMIQMMSYEPMVLLTAVGFYLATGSFDVKDIVTADTMAIIKLPGCFIGFLFILTIKLRKSPFDISTSHHAHQEIVKGLTTEMSGPCLGLMEVSEWYEKVFLYAIIGMFFMNNNPLSIIVALVVCVIVFFLEVLIDNTSARLTWNKMLYGSWGITFLFGGINILLLEVFR